MAVIELSLSASYVLDWGVWEGIREFAQNMRDAAVMHGTTSRVEYTARNNTLTLASEGKSIDARSLLLGHSTKRGNAEAAGERGEGLNLAMLALIRSGCEVAVRTGDEIWLPRLERSEKFGGEPVLVIRTRKAPRRDSVEVKIVGVSVADWEKARFRLLFIDVPDENEVFGGGYHGRLLTNPRYAGMLFVKGIYVQGVPNMQYGYDLDNLKLDRDRRMANSWDVSYETSSVLLAASKTRAEARKALYQNAKAGHPDGSGASLQYAGDDVLDTLVAQFLEEYGADAVPVSGETEARDLRYLGLSPVVVSADNLRAALEAKLGRYREIRGRAVSTPQSVYSRDTLEHGERFALLAAEDLLKDIDIEVHAEVVDFRDPAFLGLSNTATGQIWIARKSLGTVSSVLGVLCHEHAHVVTKLGDGSPGHTAQIEETWAKLWNMQWDSFCRK